MIAIEDQAKLTMKIEELEQRMEEVAEAPIDTSEIDLILNGHEERLDKQEKMIDLLQAKLSMKELEIKALTDRTEGAVMINGDVLTQAVASELVRRMTRVKTPKGVPRG